MITTPLRSGDYELRDGVRMLRPDADIPYRDGAETRLLEIVQQATDLGSESTELLAHAEGWAERYHCHPARANILRSLDIPAGATVLEIGAGTGPITRYLGEIGARVDALEPVFPRARVARERTRDLDTVQVFCGLLDDTPEEAAYDLVVVVGVLEYVASGGADRQPYLDFLRACRQRLKPGGSLVVAIENKLGVKYLTGTGEDHSGRMFDSVEDYPRGAPARTFGATALVELVGDSGFSPRLFGVFPDYKHTRVVFDTDALHAAAPDLLVNLPSFPSRFAGTRSLRLASEARVWRELARDGVGAHFTNSFLVTGSTDAEPAALWPDARLARYFSINRAPAYAAATTVTQSTDGVHFDRTYSPEPGPLIERGDTGWAYVPGRSFLEAFVAADAAGRADLLRRWILLLQDRVDGETVPLDAIPTNLVLADDGELRLIDSEFHGPGRLDDVVDRGLFWFAVHLGATTVPETWEPAKTVGDLYEQLHRWVGRDVPEPDHWERFSAVEAPFHATVTCLYPGPDGVQDSAEALAKVRDQRLWETPLGRRLHHDHDDAVAARDRLDDRVTELTAARDEQVGKVRAARAERTALRQRLKERQAECDELKRSVRQGRTETARLRKTIADLRASRAYRVADTVSRGLRRLNPRKRSRTTP